MKVWNSFFRLLFFWTILQVLLIGGSTGTMLEALQVVGDGHDAPLGEVSSTKNGLVVVLCALIQWTRIYDYSWKFITNIGVLCSFFFC